MEQNMLIFQKAQEHALQILCMVEIQPHLSPALACEQYYNHLEHEANPSDPKELSINHQKLKELVDAFVQGTLANKSEIDQLLRHTSHHWRLERMNWVDRNLLRLSTRLLRSYRELPPHVLISSSIELAKRFSTEQSPSFIHGILDTIQTRTAHS